MLGRLRMEVNDCIAAYSNMVHVVHNAEPNQLSSTTLEAAVAEIVSQHARSSTEAFHISAAEDCKVCVRLRC